MVVDWLDDPILCKQIAEAPITHKGRLDQVTQRIQELVKCPYKLIWVIGEDVLTLTPEDKAIAAALKVNLREPFEKELLRQKLVPGMVAFDAGACVGTYAIDMARMVGSTGRVIAVEPDYLNYLCLLVNLRINGCHWVEAHNVALGESSEDCFIHNDDGNIGNTVINKAGVGKAIRTTTIDALMANRVIDFIKIDVQGYEPMVLRGAHRTLSGSPNPRSNIEYCPDCLQKVGSSRQDFVNEVYKYWNKVTYQGSYQDINEVLKLSQDECLRLVGHTDDFYVNLWCDN